MGVIIRSVGGLLRGSFWQVLATSILIGGLIFLGNILMTISYNTGVAKEHIQPKLGMYFYLNQGLDQEVEGQTVMSMVEELEEAGLETSFYTKEQAFARLAQHLPAVLSDFQNYGIENPLPPTLYVLFANDEDYQMMKSILVRYNGLIDNATELTDGISFDDQEKRIQTTINAMNVIQQGSFVLVGIILCTIIAFLRYALSATITKFRDQLLVEKLLGARGWQIITPFLLYALLLVCVGFGIFVLGGIAAIHVADTYTIQLFNSSFMHLAFPAEGVGTLLLQQLGILCGITLIASYGIVLLLLQKVR